MGGMSDLAMRRGMTFDKAETERRKIEGMNRAADSSVDLKAAREVAREIALKHPERTTNADIVGRELMARGLTSNLGAAAGSIFKGKNWEFTGNRIRSTRVSNHARELKVWRYVGD